MAGQIAANCAGLTEEQAVTRISGHLHSFWTPVMIGEFGEFVRAYPDDVDPLVLSALARLDA